MNNETASKPIRVLIVDDSAVIRKILPKVFELDPEFDVVGVARDGAEAVSMVKGLGPDVVTMDIEMPVMDGLEATRTIMRDNPLPIIIFSTFSVKGAEITVKALGLGAMDFVTKPSVEQAGPSALYGVASELKAKIKLASRVRVIRHLSGEPQAAPVPLPRKPAAEPTEGGNILTVIGVSTGGPSALNRILPVLPEDFPAALVVVQHMPPTFTRELARQLDNTCRLKVKEAHEGDLLKQGIIYIAPGDKHLLMDQKRKLRLSARPPVNGFRPSIDVTMSSASNIYGPKTLGVILTGMGRDGTEGVRALRAVGGRSLAQDEASSLIFGMPKSVIEAGLAQEIVPLDMMAARIDDIARSL